MTTRFYAPRKRAAFLSCAITGAALAMAAPAAAQGILKTAPAQGILWSGEIVFVDDGSCGPGRIKMVTGSRPRGDIVLDTTPKDRHECIQRPNS